jgi:pimeloyl-ACP methyl ester carboxylesterase
MQNYPSLISTLQQTSFLTLVLTGEDDPLVTSQGSQQIAQICGGRHRELSGIGHSIVAEAPELFIKLVTEFLAP